MLSFAPVQLPLLASTTSLAHELTRLKVPVTVSNLFIYLKQLKYVDRMGQHAMQHVFYSIADSQLTEVTWWSYRICLLLCLSFWSGTFLVTFKEAFYFYFENALSTFSIKEFLLFQEQQMSEKKPHMGLLYNWIQVRITFFYPLLT